MESKTRTLPKRWCSGCFPRTKSTPYDYPLRLLRVQGVVLVGIACLILTCHHSSNLQLYPSEYEDAKGPSKSSVVLLLAVAEAFSFTVTNNLHHSRDPHSVVGGTPRRGHRTNHSRPRLGFWALSTFSSSPPHHSTTTTTTTSISTTRLASSVRGQQQQPESHQDDEWHPHDPAWTTAQLLQGLWSQIAQAKDMVKGVRCVALVFVSLLVACCLLGVCVCVCVCVVSCAVVLCWLAVVRLAGSLSWWVGGLATVNTPANSCLLCPNVHIERYQQ